MPKVRELAVRVLVDWWLLLVAAVQVRVTGLVSCTFLVSVVVVVVVLMVAVLHI